MDGFILTQTAEDALDTWGKPGVRHVAALDSGEGFVAFDGDIPVSGLVMENLGGSTIFGSLPQQDTPDGWWWQVRRLAPVDGVQETFGLFAADTFRVLRSSDVLMASMVGAGLVLAITAGPLDGAIWKATSTEWRDVRSLLPA